MLSRMHSHAGAWERGNSYIHDYLGLYKVPTSPAWKSTHA
jgi:hypothetical protein